MISDEEFDRLNSAVAQLFPLVLEQRPGKILDITAHDVTWIWQTYTSSGERINHPNGLIGTPAFMPAFPVGNADISTIVTPVEAWFRKRLTSTELGPVYEFDANCCAPPTVSGAPGCCEGLTPDTIPLTVSGTGDDCGDCFPFDVDLVFNSDSQHWKGQHDCTFGYCTISFHFMLQCYPCGTPPPVPDFIPDCDGFDYYYILTYWVTTSGTDCPPSQVGVVTWNNSEVTCDPFTLTPKPLVIDLGIDCIISVHSGGEPFSPPCGFDTLFANVSNYIGCTALTPFSFPIVFDTATGLYSGTTILTELDNSTLSIVVQFFEFGCAGCPPPDADGSCIRAYANWSCGLPKMICINAEDACGVPDFPMLLSNDQGSTDPNCGCDNAASGIQVVFSV